jgi:hypothetical protein
MTEDRQSLQTVLALYAEEHYAHARDHEYLLAEITAILTAAALVVIGLAMNNNLTGDFLNVTAILAIIIGLLNAWLIWLHNNRFKMHVSIAQQARWRMTMLALGEDWKGREKPSEDPCDIEPEADKKKRGSLAGSWIAVSFPPVIAGVYLLIGNLGLDTAFSNLDCRRIAGAQPLRPLVCYRKSGSSLGATV